MKTIVAVFAKHGLHNVAERIKLGQFFLERVSSYDRNDQRTTPERIRASFEELGPTFVKLGQLLATRPDLVPQAYVNEFEKLHAQVQPVPFASIEEVLVEDFGPDYKDIFKVIAPEPLGSASIAQVHKAILADDKEVVLKVQRPGIMQTINEDLNVLYFIAELLDKYLPEVRPYNPVGIVDEFFKTLQLETNFLVEANNIRRFAENFKDDPMIKIPHVYVELTTERVLVLESLQGIPLSLENPEEYHSDKEMIVIAGLKAYMKMVFVDGLFHGDLHAGNFFILPERKIGLIDFGVVGRFNRKTQSSVANMLLALKQEDYERLAYEYVDLAPYSEKVDVDVFAKELRDIIAPYYGLTMKNVNLGRVLMSTSSVAAAHGLKVQNDLMLFFKSIIAMEGLGRRIVKDFDFLSYSLEFTTEIVRMRTDPMRFLEELNNVWRDSSTLLTSLPRSLKWLLRKISSPEHTFRLRLEGIEELKTSIENSARHLNNGIVVGFMILSASYLLVNEVGPQLFGAPVVSMVLFMLAGFLYIFKK